LLFQAKKLIGMDNTAELFNMEPAPSRIMNTYKKASQYLKFIVLLRDPMHLLVSDVYMGLRSRKIDTSNRSNFEAEVFKQLHAGHESPCSASFTSGDFWKISTCFGRSMSFSVTMQASFLEHWLTFFKPSQFTLISSDDLFSKTDAVIKQLFSLLGLPAPKTSTKHTQLTENRAGGEAEELPEANTELYRSLYAFYKPHVQKLSSLLKMHAKDFKRIGNLEWLSKYGA